MAKTKTLVPVKEEKKEIVLLNKDLFRIKGGLEDMGDIHCSSQFAFKVAKNLRLIKPEIEDMAKILKASDEYMKEYQPKLEALAKKHSNKDKENNPVIKTAKDGSGQYDFSATGRAAFDKDILELEKKEENVEIVRLRKIQIDKYNELLEEPAEITFSMITFDMLPRELMPSQLSAIYELIIEE
jgi:hypothetical protein